MSFAAIILCVASQRLFIVVVYFVIDAIRKLLDTPVILRSGRAYAASENSAVPKTATGRGARGG